MKLVKKTQKLHNPASPLLIGEVKEGDVVKEVDEPSYIDPQVRLFLKYFFIHVLFIRRQIRK